MLEGQRVSCHAMDPSFSLDVCFSLPSAFVTLSLSLLSPLFVLKELVNLSLTTFFVSILRLRQFVTQQLWCRFEVNNYVVVKEKPNAATLSCNARVILRFILTPTETPVFTEDLRNITFHECLHSTTLNQPTINTTPFRRCFTPVITV